MPSPSTTAAKGGDVKAKLVFALDDGLPRFTYTYKRKDGGEQSHSPVDVREVPIQDARAHAGLLSLDTNGVMLVPHSTALSREDFYYKPAKVLKQYYAEMRDLVQRATGASRVVVFDHNVRNIEEARLNKPEVISEGGDARNAPVQGYAMGVHNDYTEVSGSRRIRLLTQPSFNGGSYTNLGPPILCEREVEHLLHKRYVFINVWRNISDEPIAAHPLAVCDGATISPDHFIRSALIFPDRPGETYAVKHDACQRWLYFGGMRKDEAILLKVMDSKEAPGLARWTAHTAFRDSRTAKNDPPRESIEARCIAFFEDTDEVRTAEKASGLFPGHAWQTSSKL